MLTPCSPWAWASTHSSASPIQECQELGVPVFSPIDELPLGSQEPCLRSDSRLGQTKSLAPCQGCGPPNGPFEVSWPRSSSRAGAQSRSACAAALCTYLEALGDPGALGYPLAPCPRQKPAVSLHLWEEQMACDPARWSRQSWEAGPKTPQSQNRHPSPCWASQHPGKQMLLFPRRGQIKGQRKPSGLRIKINSFLNILGP